jgi:hypothetical protein
VTDGSAFPQCTLALWKNGFTVDDGPLRSGLDLADQHFMLDLLNKFVHRRAQHTLPN